MPLSKSANLYSRFILRVSWLCSPPRPAKALRRRDVYGRQSHSGGPVFESRTMLKPIARTALRSNLASHTSRGGMTIIPHFPAQRGFHPLCESVINKKTEIFENGTVHLKTLENRFPVIFIPASTSHTTVEHGRDLTCVNGVVRLSCVSFAMFHAWIRIAQASSLSRMPWCDVIY